ncbi:hypothetical protein BJ741DRAFT_636880, partial [Chytriomyces cf. hyalinus JEL632]
MTGNEYECVPFGHTDVYMTAFSADRNTTSGFWREFPGDGAEKRIIAFLSAAKGVGTVITVLIILGIIFALFLSFILWRSKDHPAVKALSLPEATISLMGAVVSYASLLFYLGEFNKLFCKLRISMFLLGFSMIMSAMVFRSALMILMFGKKRVRKPALLARRIRAANAITIAVEFIFLAGWISKGTFKPFENKSANQVYLSCIALPSVYLSAAYYLCIGILLMLVPCIALLTRVRWEKYNQSTPMAIMFLFTVFGFVVLREDAATSYLFLHDVKFCFLTWTNVTLCLVLLFKSSISELYRDAYSRRSCSVASLVRSRISAVKDASMVRSKIGNAVQSVDLAILAPTITYHRKLLCNTVDHCIYKIRTGRNSWSNWCAGQAEMHRFRSREWFSFNSAKNAACFYIDAASQVTCVANIFTISRLPPPSLESSPNMGRRRLYDSTVYSIVMEFESSASAKAFCDECKRAFSASV